MFERMRKLIGVLLLVSLFTLGVYKPFQEYIQIPIVLPYLKDRNKALQRQVQSLSRRHPPKKM